jgi:hypothetical protein
MDRFALILHVCCAAEGHPVEDRLEHLEADSVKSIRAIRYER